MLRVGLTGGIGSGKSAVGRQLARRLGLDFLDSDEEIKARTGVDIPYIFEREGEAGFRHREAEVLDALGQGRRPPVRVTLLGYTYRTTVGVMGGVAMIPLSGEHRAACGVGNATEAEVTLAFDAAPRVTEVPDDLAAALDQAGVSPAFDALAPSRRKEHVRQVEEAKAADTRARRVSKVVDALTRG